MAEAMDDDHEGEAGGDGKRDRSGTKYPYYDLEEATRFARIVQEVGGMEALEEEVQKQLKLSPSTKGWIYRLSSAREFGLVERRGQKADAKLVVTALGRRLLLPDGTDEETATRQEAFASPALYRKLIEHYRGAPVPQVKHLSNLLVREHKILDSVAETAAEAFIASARHAQLVSDRGLVMAPGAPAPAAPPAAPPPPAKEPKERVPETFIEVPEGYTRHVFLLRKGQQVVLPLPDDLTAKDVERLYRWLKTLPIEDAEGDVS